MKVKVVHSVGEGGDNNSRDVEIIQELLNQFLSKEFPTFPLLEVNGQVSFNLVKSIKMFQSFRMSVMTGCLQANSVDLIDLQLLYRTEMKG